MFDAIIKFSLANKALIILAAIAVCISGLITALRLPIDVFPDLNAPIVTLMTEAHGLASEQVEALVTIPIESAMNGATGVRRVRSFSAPGNSIVYVEFDWEMDVYLARQIVSEKLQTVIGNLPADVPPPVMAPMSSIMGEIMLIGLYNDGDAQNKVSQMELRDIADWNIRPRLMAIPGIAQVAPIGGEVKEYQINVDPQRLQIYNLSMNDVMDAARKSTVVSTGGVLRTGGKEYQIRGLGRSYTVEQIAQSVVAHRNSASILISDVAEVTIGPAVSYGAASANANPAAILNVTKQPGANTLDLTRKIEEHLDQIKMSLPEGVVIQDNAFKQADFINVAIGNVLKALRDGALLVVLILFVFLGSFRITFISVLAMPLSIAVTFLVFKAMGVSVNTMTLGGIGIAVGALVDDAIIDVENAYRRLRENLCRPADQREPVNSVIRKASREIRKPMISATLIITVVFLPLFFLSGIEGRLLQPMGLAYIISIFASLLVAVTVTPVLGSLLLPSVRNIASGHEGWIAGHLKPVYKWMLNLSIRWPVLPLGIASLMLASAIAIIPILGRSFLPEFNEGALTVIYMTAPGTSLDKSDELSRMMEHRILRVPGVLSVQRRTGRAELYEHSNPVSAGEIEIVLDFDAIDSDKIMQQVRDAVKDVPGIQLTVGQPISHRIDHMLSGTRASIAVKLFGRDLDMLRSIAMDVEDQMADVEGVVDLAIEPMVNTPQISIRFNREAMALYGLTAQDLADFVEVAFAGEKAGNVLEGQRLYDIAVRLQEDYRNSLETIQDALVTTPSGSKLPLSTFATIEYDLGPNQIGRENSQRKLVVQANVADRDLGSVIAEIRSRVENNLDIPKGYYLEYGGQFESEQAASRAILIVSVISLMIIILILYYEFGNLGDTLLALVNLPLALIGGVWAVYLTSGIVSIASMVGFITLFGIAARNGILLISHYQTLLGEGRILSEAVKTGSMERLNPILMTALTAALALIPLAMGVGQPGKEIEAPMAIVILGGLITSTFFNMFVIPVLYAKFHKRKEPAPANA